MSNVIQQRIKDLARLQAKINLLNQVAEFASNLPQDVDGHARVGEEVQNMIKKFVETAIVHIETQGHQGSNGNLSSEENKAVKTIASNTVTNEAETLTPVQSALSPADKEERKRKAEFAKKNVKLAGRNVNFEIEPGVVVEGKIVGLDAPNVIVQVQDGGRVSVLLEKVIQ